MWYRIDVRIMGFSRLYSIFASNENEAIERLKLHIPMIQQGIATIYSIQIDSSTIVR